MERRGCDVGRRCRDCLSGNGEVLELQGKGDGGFILLAEADEYSPSLQSVGGKSCRDVQMHRKCPLHGWGMVDLLRFEELETVGSCSWKSARENLIFCCSHEAAGQIRGFSPL